MLMVVLVGVKLAATARIDGLADNYNLETHMLDNCELVQKLQPLAGDSGIQCGDCGRDL